MLVLSAFIELLDISIALTLALLLNYLFNCILSMPYDYLIDAVLGVRGFDISEYRLYVYFNIYFIM